MLDPSPTLNKTSQLSIPFGIRFRSRKRVFLTLCAKEKKVYYLAKNIYYSVEAKEGDFTFYEGIYKEEWYKESFTVFWLPFLDKI